MVKNEEWFLPYVLTAIAGLFERMVIYDIGSEDATNKIINWFVNKEKTTTDFFIRTLPHCDPIIQGALRNSMIAEAQSPIYLLVDGDEVIDPNDVNKISFLADKLMEKNQKNLKKRFGIFRRLEFKYDLTMKYDVEREHHRLYTRDAIWKGTHPGERNVYEQNDKSEVDFKQDVRVFHFHNTIRSSKEDKVPGRLSRKTQGSYHPGNLVPFNLLDELPLLRKPIEDWPVSPSLKLLQEQYRGK
jgi:hypothetical protein